jgi:heme/copper-type cytochrome/quinol oxidase subunit 2
LIGDHGIELYAIDEREGTLLRGNLLVLAPASSDSQGSNTDHEKMNMVVVIVPVVVIIILAGSIVVVLWWRRRQRRPGDEEWQSVDVAEYFGEVWIDKFIPFLQTEDFH